MVLSGCPYAPQPMSYGPRDYARPGQLYWAIVVEKRGDPRDERGILETWIYSPHIKTAGGRVALPRHICDFTDTAICDFINIRVDPYESPIYVEACLPALQMKKVPGFYAVPQLFVRLVLPEKPEETGQMCNYLRSTSTWKFWSPDINAILVNNKAMRLLEKLRLGGQPLKYNVMYYGWAVFAGAKACAFEKIGLEEGPNVHWELSMRALEQVKVYPASERDQEKLRECPYLDSDQWDDVVACAKSEVRRVTKAERRPAWSSESFQDFDPQLPSKQEPRNFAGHGPGRFHF